MKTFGRIGWVYMMTVVAAFAIGGGSFQKEEYHWMEEMALASCGNSQKSKVQSGKQVQEPVGTVIQESEVIVEVDSITPDSTVTK